VDDQSVQSRHGRLPAEAIQQDLWRHNMGRELGRIVGNESQIDAGVFAIQHLTQIKCFIAWLDGDKGTGACPLLGIATGRLLQPKFHRFAM
jgi:hypothetical protein